MTLPNAILREGDSTGGFISMRLVFSITFAFDKQFNGASRVAGGRIDLFAGADASRT